MAESPKKVAQQAEDRLEKVAESVREKFDEITEGNFSEQIRDGRFADQVDHGIDRARVDQKRRQQGGSTS